MQKCEKIKKDSKNHNSKTIDPTEFCLAPSEREKLALCELSISCVGSFGPKKGQLLQTTHEKKGKLISAAGLKKPKVFFDFFPN